MKYTKLFNSHSDYVAYTGGTDFVKPNVSYCINEDESHSISSSSVCQESVSTTLVNRATYPTTVAATATSFDMKFYQRSVIINSRCEQIIKTDVVYTASIEIGQNTSEEPRTLVGTYTYSGVPFTYSIEQDGKEPTISIADATVTCDSATYNGSSQVATNITVILSGTTLINGTDYNVTQNDGGTNVGSYTIVVTGINAYADTASGTFTINKVTPTVTAPTAKSLTYNGSAQALVNAGSTNFSTLKYSLDDNTYSTDMPSGTNATNYTVYYKVEGDSNINDVAAQTVAVSIAKANTMYTAPTANNRTYDTTSKALLNAGTVTGGTIYYSSDGSTWNTTIPNGTTAGTYTSYWKITGDSNHNDKVSSSISTEIYKVTPTVTPPTPKSGLVYNGLAQELVNAGSTDYGTLKYSLDENGTYSTSIPTATNCGGYIVYYKVDGNENVNDVAKAAAGTTTISKVTPTVTAPTAKVLTYNASAQELVNAGSTDWGTLKYSLDGITYSTSVPTATNYGSYTVYYKVDGDSNINSVAAQTVACSINEKQVTATVELSQTAYTYNGSACQPTVTVKDGATVIDPSEYTVSYSNNINAGTATVTISDNVGGNYEVIGSTTFTINKVTPTVTAPTAKSGLVYNGSAQALVNAGSTNFGTLKYSLDDSTYTANIPSGTNAASYTIYYRVDGDSNINDVVASSVGNNIAKVTPTVNAPTAKVLTYNTQAQALVNAGSTNYGTLKYSLDGITYSTSVPTATNYGSYTVYYKVDGDSNVNSVAAQTVACSINEKQVTATVVLSQTAYTYNGSACQPSVTVKDGSTVIDPSEYTVSYSNNINAGTATVTISDNVGGNYEVIGSATFTINKADPTYTAPTTKTGLVYNATAQALLNVGSVTGGTIQYSSNGSTWSTAIPSGTNATSYTSYWKIVGDSNHNDKASASISTSIAQATMTYTAPSATTYIYGNTARALLSGGTATGGSIQYSTSQSGTYTATVPTQTNAGTYITWWKAVPDNSGNYSGGTNAASISTTISKADQAAPTATGATTTYNTTATATASGGGGQGSLEWESAQSQSSVGSHTTRARWSGNSNYNVSPWSNSVTVQMNKATGSVTTAPVNTNYTYNGTARAVASAGSGTGTMYYRLGTSGSFSTTMPTMTNAGSDTLYYYASESTNYTQSPTSSIPVSVQKANSSLSFAVINITVGVGETNTNAVTVNAGDGTVTYSSNKTTAVTVNNSGTITGVGVGSATITANISSTNNYNSASTSYKASCMLVLTAKFNVISTSSPTMIASATTGFSKIEIDGVVQPSLVSVYTFTTTGEHTVKYYLKNTTIGEEAFYNCRSLISIDIPDSVTSIGVNAFQGCSGLTSIDIPDSVTSIGNGAFRECSGLTSIDIPSGVTSINNSVFYECRGLTTCTIPNSVTSIGGYAFYDCSSLSSINIPSSVTSIDTEAFQYCSSLSSIDIPNSVTSIGMSVFGGCRSLTSCTIGSGLTRIGMETFYNCTSLTSIDIPNSVTSIGEYAFQGCSGLTSIDIPNSVTSIGQGTFIGCSGLTSIYIPSGVTSIGESAFYNCRSLTSIVIPSGVTTIGHDAFYYCRSLTSIVSNATTAPSIYSDTFQYVKTGGTLRVPIGSSGYDTWMQNANYYLGKYGWTKVEQ